MNTLIDVDVLKKLEWIKDEFTGSTEGQCHICGGYKKGRMGGTNLLCDREFKGHKEDCKLWIAIKIVEEPAIPLGDASWWRNQYAIVTDAWHKEWWTEHDERMRLEARLKLANITINDLNEQISENRKYMREE